MKWTWIIFQLINDRNKFVRSIKLNEMLKLNYISLSTILSEIRKNFELNICDKRFNRENNTTFLN